jgi:hypothetical protein
MHFVLALLLLPAYASAESLCEPLDKLSDQVNYCDENSAYVPMAKQCFQSFKTLVDAENKKIQAVLNQDVKNAKGAEQEADFATTMEVLASADATLSGLLVHGKRVYNEIDDYAEDMVLPIYDAYPEDYKLDPHTPEAQQIFREKECYGEPMEDLDGIKTELRTMISDLEKTKAKAALLNSKSNAKRGKLNSQSAVGAGSLKAAGKSGPSVPNISNGDSKKHESTITGVEDDAAKAKKQP